MRLCIVFGTRPEIVKLSPVIRALKERELDFFTIHTNQHYSYNMDKVFFENLKLSPPDFNLEVGSGTHAEQTSKALLGIEKILLLEKPDLVLVQGDTNTTLSGALASAKLLIPIGHVEAGLRCFERIPEEINRKVADHLSDFLFAPTKTSEKNLKREGISDEKIFTTGNTVVDALLKNLKIVDDLDVLRDFGVEKGGFFLLTLHRQENVDFKPILSEILKGLKLISEEFDYQILFPIHPRTEKMIKLFDLEKKLKEIRTLRLIKPMGYLGFIKFLSQARLVLTDSGGIQEEACVLKVPCVTLRESTERPETLEVGSNVLSGRNSKKILRCTEKMLSKKPHWKNPFGDGRASERILDILCE
ncbi:MAG: non-hydrolyzing UDP-N-acetylglucosamine 2-epimerase [Candidatus Methanofastidiosia archaeon]